MDEGLGTHFILLSVFPSLRWIVWPGSEVWASDGSAPPCGIWGATACARSRGIFHCAHWSRSSKSLSHLCYTNYNVSSVQKHENNIVLSGGGSCKWWETWVLHKGVSKAGSVCWQLAQNCRWEFTDQPCKRILNTSTKVHMPLALSCSQEQPLIFVFMIKNSQFLLHHYGFWFCFLAKLMHSLLLDLSDPRCQRCPAWCGLWGQPCGGISASQLHRC